MCFLGISFWPETYKLLNLEAHHIFTSKDVVFHEHILPYQYLQSTTQAQSSLFYTNVPDTTSPSYSPYQNVVQTSDPTSPFDPHSQLQGQTSTTTEASQHEVQVRWSTREHRRPSYLSDYICSYTFSQHTDSRHALCLSTITSVCCNGTVVLDGNVSLSASHLFQNLEHCPEPSTYEEAATQH